MVEEIDSFIESRVESEESLTLFDAFCGTGAVSDRLKNKFNLVINDNLKWATVYTAGRLYASSCHFERLGFDPFAFLNQSDEKVQGFIYKNYAPTESSRMYFTPENAARIDYFRKQIEEWHKNKLLSEAEYMLLLASLVESVSRVSNTAGVYGAFLKKWDGRALKPIEFIKPAYNACDSLNIKIYNDKTENIISDVKCDILYLDPPYTHMFVYRLMKTVGFVFLNASLASPINSFVTIEDMMRARAENREINKSNHSTFISKNENGEYEAYCKTFGASKYESSLICYAMSMIHGQAGKIRLYEILEGNLKKLPKASLQVLEKMGTVDIIETDLTFEKRAFEASRGDCLRSPRYQYNLLRKLGEKHCALCGCAIPDLIQGAHVWPVASIKADRSISAEDKVQIATDGDNGIWLCENHHKLFDRNIIAISGDGTVKYNRDLPTEYIPYLQDFTENRQLPSVYLNEKFRHYIELRNKALDAARYTNF